MTLQRCQFCRRLTVANLCSMCHAGAAGEHVDPEYLAVLAAEENRFAVAALLGIGRDGGPENAARVAYDAMRAAPVMSVPEGAEPVRVEVTSQGPIHWYAADAMRADPRYLGPMETWPQPDPESMRNMVAQQQRAANADMESYLARLNLPRRSRAWSRLRRWLRGAP